MNRGFLLLWILLRPGIIWCLGLTELAVPTHKMVGEDVKLVCRFDMDGEKLYSVKWYRNEQEFYRYVPNDRPKLQIFPQSGITVERSRSSKQHVTLKHLQQEASGTYRCEVSAEAPSFRTKHREMHMVVVQQPSENKIIGAKNKYFLGDTVNVTCISENSHPPASLTWKVNGIAVKDVKDPVENVNDRILKVERYDVQVSRSRKNNGYNTYDKYDKYGTRSRQNRPLEESIIINEEVKKIPLRVHLKDKFSPHPVSKLDTASLNMQFVIEERHMNAWVKEGLELECIASIGPVYWHKTVETVLVSEKEKEMFWGSNASIASDTSAPVLMLLFSTLSVLASGNL